MAFVIPPEKETHSKIPHFSMHMNKHLFEPHNYSHQLHDAAMHMFESNSNAHHLQHPALQVLVDHAKRARSFHPVSEHILNDTVHEHTIPTQVVFAVEPLAHNGAWLLIHPADINHFQVYEDRRLCQDECTKTEKVYHMNAYTIIDGTPRVILPVNMIALDNIRGTIISLDRFHHFETKNGPPLLHHIVTDRVGCTHDLCSARYVARGSYQVHSEDALKDSRGKIVPTEGVVPFPEEVEFYSFYYRKDGTTPIYSNNPEIRICSVPVTSRGKQAEIGTQRYEDLTDPDPPSRPPLRRKTSILAKLRGTIKSKVRSMSTPIRPSKKADSSVTTAELSHVRSQQATAAHSIRPPAQSSPMQIAVTKSPIIPPPQNSLTESPQVIAADADVVSPPRHSQKNSPDEEADDPTYLTPATTAESFPSLPSPLIDPNSPKKFEPGQDNLPLAFDGDEIQDEERLLDGMQRSWIDFFS